MIATPRTFALAFTGASGMHYGIRLLEKILDSGNNVYLMYSPAAQIVAQQEMKLTLSSRTKETEEFLIDRFKAKKGQLRIFGQKEWFAPVASGSNLVDAMIICPCSMGTLAAIAAGLAKNLIERAADVMLKENQKIILVPRETPFSAIHLENMQKLVRCGSVILPANPGFYNHPERVQDLIDFVVARILDHLNIEHSLIPRWGK
tara:strand:+ start:1777 stop:2388 length:612 start_codon:yes stop_codon:yes gene_type:complete